MMKRQQGFMLLELMITVAITGLMAVFLVTAIHQMITVTERGNDRMAARHDLRNAAHWVTRDGQMAETAGGGNELVLTLPGGSSNITYAVVGSELRRIAGGSERIVARNISSISFSVQNRIITMNITSSPQGRLNVSEQATYKIRLRPTE